MNTNELSFRQLYIKKIYDILEKNDLLYIVKQLLLLILSCLLIFIFTYPSKWIDIFIKMWMFENIIIAKSFIIIYIVFNYQEIRKKISKIQIKIPVKEDKNKINWIKTDELVKHLLIEKSFKILDIEKKFNIWKTQTFTLCKKLEDVWILTRGANNSRILNEDYTQEQITKAIVFSDWDIEKIKIHPEEVKENYFTTQPLNKKS